MVSNREAGQIIDHSKRPSGPHGLVPDGLIRYTAIWKETPDGKQKMDRTTNNPITISGREFYLETYNSLEPKRDTLGIRVRKLFGTFTKFLHGPEINDDTDARKAGITWTNEPHYPEQNRGGRHGGNRSARHHS